MQEESKSIYICILYYIIHMEIIKIPQGVLSYSGCLPHPLSPTWRPLTIPDHSRPHLFRQFLHKTAQWINLLRTICTVSYWKHFFSRNFIKGPGIIHPLKIGDKRHAFKLFAKNKVTGAGFQTFRVKNETKQQWIVVF